MRPKSILAVLLPLLLLGWPFIGEGRAASLEVTPVVVEFAAGQTATTIVVANHGGGLTAMQARAYHWAQAGDQDELTPTPDVIVSPPIFTVAEGASQTIRLLLRGRSAAPAGEGTYRLVLDEVPPAAAPSRHVVLALRMSLPIFVTTAAAQRTPLKWRTQRDAAGQTVLTASNTAALHDKVSAIDLTLADGSHPKVVSRGTNPYLLAGAERHWIVQGNGSGSGGPLHLTVTTLTGKSELTLTP